MKNNVAHYDKSSPGLLAQQGSPDAIREVSDAESIDWGILRSHLEARLLSLRMWRNSWWTQNWSTLAEYILPRRSTWLTQSTGGFPAPNNMTRGRPINGAIKDPTATFAAGICSSGLMSGLASPSRPWFKIIPAIKTHNIDEEARAWMDEIEDRVYSILSGSNFYNAFAQECEDLVVFGTGPSIIYEDEADIIRCYNPTVGEYFLSSSATMRVDGLYRSFVMTTSQIVDFFGVENCPEDIQKLWKQKGSALDKERIIAHSIEPNFSINDSGKVKGNFAWREVYWVYGSGSKFPLSIKGFIDQPFTAARWSTQSNDAYGRSVGMDVLPDTIQLQIETSRKAEGIEKGLRPPLIADISMKNQPSSILPGHITYVQGLNASNGMRSIYNTNFDLNHVTADLQQIQERIKKGFFNDLFLMLERGTGTMTATEVSAKINEKMQVLGPVIEALLSESLKPKLKRIFGIMKRRGFIPPAPESMKGVAIDVQFVSMLALAQKGAATGGMERIASLIGNLTAVFPQARDLLNIDAYIAEMNDLLGNPQKIIHGPKELAAIRQQQIIEQKKQQDMNSIQQAAAAAHSGAKAANVLSDTQIGGGQTALNQMLGLGGGGD